MKRASLVCLAVFLTASLSRAEIDFTSFTREYDSEGIRYQEVVFKDDTHPIRMEVPRGWTCRGRKDQLQLAPADVNFAEGLIQVAVLPAPQPLDDAATSAFVQQTLSSVPRDAQAAAVVSQGVNPIILEGHESYGVVLSYIALGQKFRRSAIVVNFPHQRLYLRFSAPETKFEVLNREFEAAVRTWERR